MKLLHFINQLKYYNYFSNHKYFYYRYAFNMMRRMIKKPTLIAAEIFFEPRCNFKCWHCSSSKYLNKKDVGFDLKTIETILTKLKSVGCVSVCYVGGEPTLNDDLTEIISLTNSYHILPSIITNASLLTEGKIDELFQAGLANIGFSLQSSRVENYRDLVKYPNVHDKILGLIDYCVNQKYVCSICAVPTNKNLFNGDFEDIVQLATRNKLRLNVNLPASIGRLAGNLEDMLTKESWDIFYTKYLFLENVLPDFKQLDTQTTLSCPMGRYSVYILPDGEVCPCTFVHVSYGNILNDEVDDILKRMKNSSLMKNITAKGCCPIGMDRGFAKQLNNIICKSRKYPPRWNEID